MHYSDSPTDYIFARAETNSEFDTCDYIIIHVNGLWKQRMLERLAIVQSLMGDDDCKHIAYRASPVGFYTFSSTAQETEFENIPD